MYSYEDMGPILIKKSLEEGPISQKLRKMVKSAIFVVEKPLEMGPVDLQKFWKTKQNKTKPKQKTTTTTTTTNVESAVFEGEKL